MDLESLFSQLGMNSGINIGKVHCTYIYRRISKSSRVFYEVIQERRPCRLYFDLEYDINLNPQLDGESMLNNFKEFIIEMLQKTFEISITLQDIVDLESSSNEKFSRHLIVHTGRYLFSSNYQVIFFSKHLETYKDLIIRSVTL